MKVVFISSNVEEVDILENSFLDGITSKITNHISLGDIPEDTTHISFIYHKDTQFPFIIKEKYELFTELYSAEHNMVSDDFAMNLKYVEEIDMCGEFVDYYYVDKDNNRYDKNQLYTYRVDRSYAYEEYLDDLHSYQELEMYHTTPSCEYFREIMYIFNELKKRNTKITIDLLTCNFDASIIQKLEMSFPNLTFRVSTNDTGNPKYGGDWIMEYTSDETDSAYVRDLYFNDTISQFTVVLNEYASRQGAIDSDGSQIYSSSSSTETVLYWNDFKYFVNGAGIMVGVKLKEATLAPLTAIIPRKTWYNNQDQNRTYWVTGITHTSGFSSKYSSTMGSGYRDGVLAKRLIFDQVYHHDFRISNESFDSCTDLEKVIFVKQTSFMTNFKGYFDNPTDGYNSGIRLFRDCKKLKYVDLTGLTEANNGSEITDLNLPRNVFSGCDLLTNVILPEKNIILWRNAFSDCGFTNFDFTNIKYIHRYAFSGCEYLNNVYLDNINNLYYDAFLACTGLTKVSIGTSTSDSITFHSHSTNHASVFRECTSLKHVIWNETYTTQIPSKFFLNAFPSVSPRLHFEFGPDTRLFNTTPWFNNNTNMRDSIKTLTFNQSSINNFLFYINGYNIDGVGAFTETYFSNYPKILERVYFETVSELEINNNAFAGNLTLQTVSFDSSIKTINIKQGAFNGCHINSLYFGNCDNVEIGNYAFEVPTPHLANSELTYDYKLTLYFGNNLLSLSIGYRAFKESKIESLNIPKMNITFNTNPQGENNAFENCVSLKTIDWWEKSPGSLPTGIFKGCNNITSVIIRPTSKLDTIKSNDFENCVIERLRFDNESSSSLSIEANAFSDCCLNELIIPPGIENDDINEFAFNNGTIDTLYINNDVFDVTNGTFKGATVNSVYKYTIVNPEELFVSRQYAYINPAPPGITHFLSRLIITNRNIFILNDNTEITNLDNPLTTVSTSPYKSTLRSVTIEIANEINSDVFKDFNSLEEVNIFTAVSQLNNRTFLRCSALKQLSLPTSLTHIHTACFQESGLEIIDLSHCTGLINIGSDAFYKCTSLLSFTLPVENTINIASRAFSSCSALTSIDLENVGLSNINNLLFEKCNILTKIVLPKNLSSIGSESFSSTTTKIISELILPPDFNWINNIQSNSFTNTRITTLLYNSSYGTITNSWGGATITLAIPYESNSENKTIKLIPPKYTGFTRTDPIFGYTIEPEKTNITFDVTNKDYIIDTTILSQERTFSFQRKNSSNLLLVVFNNTSSMGVDFKNNITGEIISSSSIRNQVFNSDLIITLTNNSATLKIREITFADLQLRLGTNNDYKNIELYNIVNNVFTFSGSFNNPNGEIHFVDCSFGKLNLNNRDITSVRIRNSFNNPVIENDTSAKIYEGYRIYNGKLYHTIDFEIKEISKKLQFNNVHDYEIHDVCFNRFVLYVKEPDGSEYETPIMTFKQGIEYRYTLTQPAEITSGILDIYDGLYNRTIGQNISNTSSILYAFGGYNKSNSNTVLLNGIYYMTVSDPVGNYYLGHSINEGVGGLNENMIISNTSLPKDWNNWLSVYGGRTPLIVTLYDIQRTTTKTEFVEASLETTDNLVKNVTYNDRQYAYVNGFVHPNIQSNNTIIILEVTNRQLDLCGNNIFNSSIIGNNVNIKHNTSNNIFINNRSQDKPYYIYIDILQFSSNGSETFGNIQYEIERNNEKISPYRIISHDLSYNLGVPHIFDIFNFPLTINYAGDFISPFETTPIGLLNINWAVQNGNYRMIIEDKYTNNKLLTFLLYFNKLECLSSGSIKALLQPYFVKQDVVNGEQINMFFLRSSPVIPVYMGSIEINYNNIIKTVPIIRKIRNVTEIELINFVNELREKLRVTKKDENGNMILDSNGIAMHTYPSMNELLTTIQSKFSLSSSNIEKDSIIDLFIRQHSFRVLSKQSSVSNTQQISVFHKSILTSKFREFNPIFNKKFFNNLKSSIQSKYVNNSIFPTLEGPFNYRIGSDSNGGDIVSENGVCRIYQTKRRILQNNQDIHINNYIDLFRDVGNNVTIEEKLYYEMKEIRREFDVTIVNNSFNITYTPNSIHNKDYYNSSIIEFSGNALDSNGDLHLNEGELYKFNQTHESNLDTSGILHDALTLFPVDQSGNPLKIMDIDFIPSLGDALNKTRLLYLFRPELNSPILEGRIRTNKYYYGSIREATDISFAKWYYNELWNESQQEFNIILDYDESKDSIRTLKNNIYSIPITCIKNFVVEYEYSPSNYENYNIIFDNLRQIIMNNGVIFDNFVNDFANIVIYLKLDSNDSGINENDPNNNYELPFSKWESFKIDNTVYKVEDILEFKVIDSINGYTEIDNLTTIKAFKHVEINDVIFSNLQVNEFYIENLKMEQNSNYRFTVSPFLSNKLDELNIINIFNYQSGDSYSIPSENFQNDLTFNSNTNDVNQWNISFNRDPPSLDNYYKMIGEKYDNNGDWYHETGTMGGFIHIENKIPFGTTWVNNTIMKSREIHIENKSFIVDGNRKLYDVGNTSDDITIVDE